MQIYTHILLSAAKRTLGLSSAHVFLGGCIMGVVVVQSEEEWRSHMEAKSAFGGKGVRPG